MDAGFAEEIEWCFAADKGEDVIVFQGKFFVVLIGESDLVFGDVLDVGAYVQGEFLRLLKFLNFFDVGGFWAGEFFFAVGEVYGGAFGGEGSGGFQGGIAATDDEDVLVFMLGGIDEAV